MRRSNVDFSKVSEIVVVEDLGMGTTEYGNLSYHSERINCKVSGKPKTYIRQTYASGMLVFMIPQDRVKPRKGQFFLKIVCR